jgi:hypothetical protein
MIVQCAKEKGCLPAEAEVRNLSREASENVFSKGFEGLMEKLYGGKTKKRLQEIQIDTLANKIYGEYNKKMKIAAAPIPSIAGLFSNQTQTSSGLFQNMAGPRVLPLTAAVMPRGGPSCPPHMTAPGRPWSPPFQPPMPAMPRQTTARPILMLGQRPSGMFLDPGSRPIAPRILDSSQNVDPRHQMNISHGSVPRGPR